MRGIVRRAQGAALVAMIGCGVDEGQQGQGSQESNYSYESAATEIAYRGPGQWQPSFESSALPVDISLITTGLRKGSSTLANGTGDHAVFYIGGNACAVDATTGNMDTDTSVDGTIIEVSDVQGNTALVLSDTGIQEVELSDGAIMGGSSQLHRSGSFGWAGFVADEVVGLTLDCQVSRENGAMVALPEMACARGTEVAAFSGGLLLATQEGLMQIEPQQITLLDAEHSEHLAVDLQSDTFLTSIGSVIRAQGGSSWRVDYGSEVFIRDLVDGGDLGLFLVDLVRDDSRVVDVLDATTGELLGTLDVRESTEAIDVSPMGGLLLQVRKNDVVSWRITR